MNSLLLLLLLAMASPSRQDVLSCGSTTYQVSFEPNRPIFTSFISSAHNMNGGSPSSSSNGMNTGSSGQQASMSAQMSSSTAKYIFKPLDQFLPAGAQVCNLGPSLSQLPPPPVPLDPPRFGSGGGGGGRIPIGSFDGRLVVTKCEHCSDCLEQLSFIHRFLTRRALDSGLLSLLVIVPQKDGQYDHVRLPENTNTKFVFMDEDVPPTQLAFCELADNGDSDALKSFSRTSVLFVSVSFIILMVISLAWLVFYYVQRFRYAHAKDRLQRRLFNAAKKALTRIPTRPVKAGDKELDSDCPVCIDPYRQGDIVRMLPCRHIFHKSCVDPWLLEHRTCPMCKSDILKAFGYHVSVSSRRRAQFSSSIVGMDEEGGGGGVGGMRSTPRGNDSDHLSMDANSSTGSESNFPFPVVSEVHDPFSFSPSSPQLVQVMHATNARAFSIIPLTVHSPSLERHSPPTSARSGPVSHPSQTGIIVASRGGSGISPDANSFALAGCIEHHELTAPTSPPPSNQESKSEVADNVHQRTYSITDGVSVNARLFRAMTGSGRRRRADRGGISSGTPHGHVVNLVHVRSRSLSQSQIQTALSDESSGDGRQEIRPTAVLRTSMAASDSSQQKLSPQRTMVFASFPLPPASVTDGVSKEGERHSHSSGSISNESVKGKFVRKHNSGRERSSIVVATVPTPSASEAIPTSPPTKRPYTTVGHECIAVEMEGGNTL